jgi:hypothetical protein
MKLYILNLLIGLDQFANVVFGGAPDRTISYRTYQHRDHWAGAASVKLIDGIFRLFGQQDHCRSVFEGGDNQTTEVLG